MAFDEPLRPRLALRLRLRLRPQKDANNYLRKQSGFNRGYQMIVAGLQIAFYEELPDDRFLCPAFLADCLKVFEF